MAKRKRTPKRSRAPRTRAAKAPTPKRSRSKSRASTEQDNAVPFELEQLRAFGRAQKEARERGWAYEDPTSGDVQVQRGRHPRFMVDHNYQPYPIGTRTWQADNLREYARKENADLAAQLRYAERDAAREAGFHSPSDDWTDDQRDYMMNPGDHDDPGGWPEREGPEIEDIPNFDEVYDYIDALVEEYDMDAHELFEIAFGYADEI